MDRVVWPCPLRVNSLGWLRAHPVITDSLCGPWLIIIMHCVICWPPPLLFFFFFLFLFISRFYYIDRESLVQVANSHWFRLISFYVIRFISIQLGNTVGNNCFTLTLNFLLNTLRVCWITFQKELTIKRIKILFLLVVVAVWGYVFVVMVVVVVVVVSVSIFALI